MLSCAAVAFASVPAWTGACAQTRVQVTDCSSQTSSTPYDQLEQDQIFILSSGNCSGRFTVHVTMSVDAQHSDGEGSEVTVSIHDVYDRNGQHVIRTGPDLCEGRPGAHDAHFNSANVACHVTRALSPNNQNELTVHFFTNATANQRMRTWWVYEPGF